MKFRIWETRLFKMPRLVMPRLEMGTRITIASEPYVPKAKFPSSQSNQGTKTVVSVLTFLNLAKDRGVCRNGNKRKVSAAEALRKREKDWRSHRKNQVGPYLSQISH